MVGRFCMGEIEIVKVKEVGMGWMGDVCMREEVNE